MKKTDSDCSDVWRLMFRIVDCMREQNSEVKDKLFYKLTFNQLRMIHRVYLYRCENGGRGISLKALAERLGITSAAASEMVDTLVKKNVLIRSVDQQDRRAISIDVGEMILKRFSRSEAVYEQMASDFFEELDEETRSAFVKTLRLLVDFTQKKVSENKRAGE